VIEKEIARQGEVCMKLCKVIGNVVSTVKDKNINNFKLLIVQPVDFIEQQPYGDPLVAIDAVGAGQDELVLIVQGSSGRMTALTENKPSDCTIMAIVDFVEFQGKLTYSKR